MPDDIKQFCFFCQKEVTFRYTIKQTAKHRGEGYNCIECGGGATCDAKLRTSIEQKQASQLAHAEDSKI